jgi:ComF family protein
MLKFDDQSKKTIHRLKYYDRTGIAKSFAKSLYSIYRKEIDSFDFLIPVPMHRLKRMLRFYNQAFVLAKEISLMSNKPILSDVLLKTKWTKPQASLSQKARNQNLKGSFEIQNATKIQGKKIILVDDVATTGSTAKACAQELKQYASEVFVLCIAFT